MCVYIYTHTFIPVENRIWEQVYFKILTMFIPLQWDYRWMNFNF